ncbi:hypothetical protein ACTFIZ_005138 [Dictyostelium cf. discoideum]
MNKIEIDISDNSLLFFKIWRNCVLKKLIFKFLIMFNLLSFPVDINSSQKFIKNNDKQFIKSLLIKVGDIKKEEIIEKLNNLPNYIESISLYQPNNSGNSFNLCESLELLLPPVSHLNINIYNQSNLKFVPTTNNNSFSNLTILEFSSIFNQEIGVNILPITLKKLKFGTYFNKALNENVLPKFLKIIIFGHSFDQSLKYLPNSIEEIKFSPNSSFKNIINSNKLPQSLKKLTLPRDYNMCLIKGGTTLPNKLEKLKITNLNVQTFFSFNDLRMKHLKLKVYNKNGNLSTNQEILNLLNNNNNNNIISIIPPSVTNLIIFYNSYHGPFRAPPPPPHQQLSSQFSSLNLNATTPIYLFYWIYEKSSKLFLNKFESIKSISVNIIESDYRLDYHSETSLKHLIKLDLSEFYYKFYIKPVKDFKVFKNLKCLRIGNYNSTITSNTLPQQLELLELGSEFRQPIHKKWLPISIKHIIILNDETPISINSLPNSLESIWISDKHYQLDNNCFRFFIPLIGKLNIVDSELIKKIFNKIFKKKYEFNLY